MEGRIGKQPPREYPRYLLRYTRGDGVTGHCLTADRSRALRKAESGERAGWLNWQLLGCEVVEAWERKVPQTAKERHMEAKQGKGA